MTTIIKRNGKKEQLDLNKIHTVVGWSCEGITGVSISQVELKSQIQFYEGMNSEEIHETLINSAAELISEETPNYQYVASKLINFDLRKRAYGTYDPWTVKQIVERGVERGFYNPDLMSEYTNEDWAFMEGVINHDRDYDISYAGMVQFRTKYLVKNKTTMEYFETPQIAYMLIAASGSIMEEGKLRRRNIKQIYNHLSKFDFTLPTPIMAGLRTKVKQFSSCTLIDAGDSLDSINAAASAIVKYASNKAGIGLNIGRIRAVGSPIRNGEATHTGIVPFIKYFNAALKSCNQGGLRASSGTFYYPMWHYEFEDMIVLKNNKGTEETRVRSVDYGVQLNRFLIQRLIDDGEITLFSPHDVPDLYEAFFIDQQEFARLYVQYENDSSIRKKTMSAIDAFSILAQERVETGRIYIQFVDNTNEQGMLGVENPVYMSNLCAEVVQSTKPLEGIDDINGLISLCTLAAYNMGNIKSPGDFEKLATVVVGFLDNILSYQTYLLPAAESSTLQYRNIGIGISNLAYFLAKNNQKYTDESSPEFLHPYMEAMSYYTIQASAKLAEQKGSFEGFASTKWAQGKLPIDTYRPAVDTIVANDLQLDWEALRELTSRGMRNATILSLMPVETSSQLVNATNGVEPPRGLISVKNSKDGSMKQVVPEIHRLKNKYDLLWDQTSPRGYLNIMATIQKFIDQSISTNTSYNPEFYPDNEIPLMDILGDMVYACRMGIKTLYYNNTFDMSGEVKFDDPLPSSQDDQDLEECESCVL